MLMAYNVFNGSGAFNDPGKVIARISVHYTDDSTFVSDDSIAVHIRDWSSGSISCGATEPFYTTQPSSPLAGVVWSDAGSTTFYDLCEFRLPARRRSTTIDRVRVEAALQDHYCSSYVPHVYPLCQRT